MMKLASMLQKKYARQLHKAIDYILKHDQNNNIEADHDDAKIITYDDGCKGITNCTALNILIEVLKYQQDHEIFDKMTEYIEMNKYHILNAYHHILDTHLNEDKIYKSRHNQQFKMIY
eukprot:355460_1